MRHDSQREPRPWASGACRRISAVYASCIMRRWVLTRAHLLIQHRWPPTRWSRWRRLWRATAFTRTTGSLHARELTRKRDKTTWCATGFSRCREPRPSAWQRLIAHAMTAGGYGVRCELRLGQSKLDDVSLPAGTFARSSLQISLLWSDACLRRHLQRCSRARPTILTCTLFMMCRTTLQRYVMTVANHLVFAV